uniref:Gse1 coiled-coil protein n=1 Tax=Cyprinus carpio TaxID=7962 RepID=A0A8C2HWP1_CYPCA
MNDPELTPISKTQQRMALAFPGEESALSGSVCRPERNGIFFIHCFICGSAVTPGKELSLQVKYQRKKDGPFFPFLQGQDPAPGAPEIGPDGDALVCADNGIITCDKQWIHASTGDSDAPDSCDINITSDDERERAASTHLDVERSQAAKCHSSFSADECACYICGSRLSAGGHFRVFVQKQERASSEPFFPFLWLHTPPPGAVPLSLGGYTLICTTCHSSLMQQWQGFELADVPVLQRLYVVPLSTGAATPLSPPAMNECGDGQPKIISLPSMPQNRREACYLCGQDCGREVRMAYTHAGASKARSAMYFPFINLLPCPPSAQSIRNGRVYCCVKCHSILEGIWAKYCLCLSEELITSVTTFLERYHLAMGRGGVLVSPPRGPLSTPSQTATTTASHTSICYLCGEELSGGTEYQLHVNPPGRCGEREPFFPFLTVHPPAPRARPADATGLVSACALCYHDLLGQWTKHESQGSESGPSSSPWARQYNCNTFICFFCRKEKRRPLGLKAVCVDRLPVFFYAPRVSQTLVIDNGKQLTIGSCVECKSMVLAGQNMKTISGITQNKALMVEESASSSKDAEDRPLMVTVAEVSEQDHTTSLETRKTSGTSPLCSLKVEKADISVPGMSHEPKSPSLGMISTATRTTATVSPLTPSPLNGSIVPNGSPASQSTHSGFAAALRKLAKQAEEPRGSSISSESSPVSSPATNHSSPVSTPKRGPMGPVIVPPGGHSIPSTPPVVTIAPTKTINGLWRSESRHVREAESGPRGVSRDRLSSEAASTQEKVGPTVPAHLIGNPYAFGLTPTSVMQDSRFQPLNLPRQMPHAVPPGSVPEEYLRGFRPYATAEELRMPSLPLGLDPATAAAAAAYYHPGYLPHPSFSHYRMDDPFCLSAMRSPFYPLPAGGALPPLHPSAVHMHLPGVRYPGDLGHPSLSSLQSERLSEREREREKEREREREIERQKERSAREKAVESHYLAELHGLRGPPDDRAKPADRITMNRPDKTKEPTLTTPKPIQPGLHHSLNSTNHPVPSLVSAHGMYLGPGGAGPGSLTVATMLQRTNEEERWLARQRKLRQEKEDRQYQVSEFRQQVIEQHLDLGRQGEIADLHIEGHRPVPNHHEPNSRDRERDRDAHPLLGAPPPLISPKHQHKDHAPPPPTTLWNPASLIETSTDSRRALHEPQSLGHYDISRLPLPPYKHERNYTSEKLEEGSRKRDTLDKYPPIQPSGFSESNTFLAELEKSTQSFLNQQRAPLSLSGPYGELSAGLKSSGSFKSHQGHSRLAPDAKLVYDEFLQQHRRAVSKLDLEEKRRREAREKGYYYELDDSYDESDEEEVRAHLRRVAEQPPLKLDDSTEKVEFLQMFDLTTLARREEMMEVKRRKRRRMLRERSPSLPAVQSKRPTSEQPPPLITRFTPEDMNNSPELEDKKRFLTIFSLNHVTQQQRRDNERVEELLKAIKQKSLTLDNIRYNPHPLCSSPATLYLSSQSPVQSDELMNGRPPSPSASVSVPQPPAEPLSHSDHHRSLSDPLRLKDSSMPAALPEKCRANDSIPGRSSSLLNSVRQPPFTKESSVSVNGKTKPWESFIAEEFAQQFHESVLQSTQKALQKSKGGALVMSEQNHAVDSSVHYNIPELQTTPGRSKPHPHPPSLQPNGQHCPPHPSHQELSTEESEEDDTEEDEPTTSRWQGIEAIFEAYQEYAEEQSIERQVLHSQCRRLEAHHYNLSLTAEQLSHSMGELMAQKQKLAAERENLQAELEHFKKCLTLPQNPWSRGHFKGYPPR